MGKTIKKKIKSKNKTNKHKLVTPEYIQSNILVKNKQVCTNKYVAFESKLNDIFKENNINFYKKRFYLENDIIHNLRKATVSEKYNPKDDFYSYINYKWLSSTTNPNDNLHYTTQIDDFRIVQDKVYRELNDILVDYFTNPVTKNTKKAICIKNTYKSLLTLNTHKQQQLVANNIVLLFDNLRTDNTRVWELLAFLNSNEITALGCPFIWNINPDEKNPKKYKSYINLPSVSLIDTNIYFDDGTDVLYKKKYKLKFIDYLNKLFENAFGTNYEFNVENIITCEYKILLAMGYNKLNNSNTYNLITKKESLEIYKFDWEMFAKQLGFSVAPNSFICSNVNYLLSGTTLLLEEWNSPEWREYWIYLYIRQQQRFSVYGRKIYYDFFGIFQLGLEGMFDDALKPIFFECFLFNTFLTNSYINKHKNIEIENYVSSMAEDLRLVFIRIIHRTKWLQPKTKEKALKKLDNLKFIIGSPHKLIDDPLLDYDSNDAWGNMVKKALWCHDVAINLNEKEVVNIPLFDWSGAPPNITGTQAYAVNAYYIPTQNNVFISLGYLQKPFIDLDNRSIEYNLARVGFTIAHEMSHALDNFGSKYDEHGILNDWWSKIDKKRFYKIQEDIVKQYEEFALRDGIKFNAWPTIGEDLADLSGILICLEYLLDLQLKNSDILPIQKLSFQSFFVYFAIQQKQKITKKALLAQLKTNPHPLDKYRTNVPLSRCIIFRIIYNIEKRDKMWWHIMNKVWLDFK
jgi:putative endopeptidase